MNEHMWPAELRDRVVSEHPLCVRFPQRGWADGQLLVLLLGCAVVLIALLVLVDGEWGPGAGLLTFGSLVVPFGILPKYWWTEVERIREGWRIDYGIARWKTRSVSFQDAKVMTTGVFVEDLNADGVIIKHKYFLRVDFLAIPFAGAPPAIEIARGYGATAEELKALGQVIRSFAPNRIRETGDESGR